MDQHQNTFQMLGLNMFAKAPPSGYQANYFAQIQTNQNQQKFDQLLQLMQQQEQQVSEYNQNIKQKEDQLYNLDQQSQQLQRELIQKDKSRNEHNQIHYKNYLPSFNIQQQNEQIEDIQQPLFNSKYQQYNQGMQPDIQQEIQMSQNPRKNTPLNTRPQSIQKNDKLQKMQQQIEEQNEFIKQLTNLIGIKKQNYDNKDDSLTILMNEKEDQSKLKILNEIKELKQRIEDYDQQKLKQPQQMYPIIPQQQQYNNQMIPFQNQFGMYPQQMIPPPPFGYPPPGLQQQIDDEESDDDNFNNEILMKLLAEQNQKNKRNNRQKNMKNSQQSHQRKQNKTNIPQEQTQNDSQDV